MSKFESLTEDFSHALLRLEEVLKLPKTDVTRDSAIKRFEIVFDLGWKTAKAFLEEEHNAICTSPRTCLRELVHQGVIAHDQFWLEITSIRNYVAHMYSEPYAEKIYLHLPKALEHFRSLLEALLVSGEPSKKV